MTTTPLDSLIEEYNAYTSKTQPFWVNFVEGINRIRQLMAMMSKNSSLVLDASFKEILFEALDSAYNNLREIVNIVVPKPYKDLYDYSMYSFLEFGSGRSLMKSGINNIDSDDIEAAESHLGKCIHFLNLIAKFEDDMKNKLIEQSKEIGRLSRNS